MCKGKNIREDFAHTQVNPRFKDASKLKSGMKSACTIRNRERWRVDGKEEGWMIERGGDLR